MWGPANGIGWSFRRNTPFLLSANELDFSDQYPDSFYLYRVFNFSKPQPQLFVLKGSLHQCDPDALPPIDKRDGATNHTFAGSHEQSEIRPNREPVRNAMVDAKGRQFEINASANVESDLCPAKIVPTKGLLTESRASQAKKAGCHTPNQSIRPLQPQHSHTCNQVRVQSADRWVSEPIFHVAGNESCLSAAAPVVVL